MTLCKGAVSGAGLLPLSHWGSEPSSGHPCAIPRPEHTARGLTPWEGSSGLFLGRELPAASSSLSLGSLIC